MSENHPNETKSIAYHEAAHAVAGHIFGRCVSEISIEPEDDGSFGRVCFATLDKQPDDRRQHGFNLLCGLLAAHLAESHFRDEHGMDVGPFSFEELTDTEDTDLAREWHDASDVFQMQRDRADRLVKTNWELISRLADVLCDRLVLKDEAAEQIIEALMIEEGLVVDVSSERTIVFRPATRIMPGWDEPNRLIRWQVECWDDSQWTWPMGLAFIMVDPLSNDDVDWPKAQLRYLYVLEEMRREGIGSDLIKACRTQWPNIDLGSPVSDEGSAFLETVER